MNEVELIKKELKQAIVKLNMQDNPSQIVYKQNRREGMPSVTHIKEVTKMTWQELMEDLGLGWKRNKRDNTMKRNPLYYILTIVKNNYKFESPYLIIRRKWYNYGNVDTKKITLDTIDKVAKTIMLPKLEVLELVYDIDERINDLFNEEVVDNDIVLDIINQEYKETILKGLVKNNISTTDKELKREE